MSIKRIFFRLALLFLVISVLLGLDYIGGFVDNTSIVRESSRMFRAEAVPLFLKTRQLVPNVTHTYRVAERNDPEFPEKPDAPRQFRTHNVGTIIGSERREETADATYILFLGGSTTETNEVDEPFRFPYLVGKLLSKESNRSFIGLNLGVRGNTSRDSINLLLNHPVTKKAQWVVMMNNINDRLLLALIGTYDIRLPESGAASWSSLVENAIGFIDTLWDFLSHRSNIVFLLRYRLLGANPFTGERPTAVVDNRAIDYRDEDLEKHRELFRENILLFVTLTTTLGKRPILMTQPLGRASLQQESFNEVIRTVAKTTNTTLIDLDKILNGNRRLLFLPDQIHLSNAGSRLVADFIVQQLRPLLTKASPKNYR